MGQVAAAIKDVQPAKQIIDEMVSLSDVCFFHLTNAFQMSEAVQQIKRSNSMISGGARL